jgi:hypothetical protein
MSKLSKKKQPDTVEVAVQKFWGVQRIMNGQSKQDMTTSQALTVLGRILDNPRSQHFQTLKQQVSKIRGDIIFSSPRRKKARGEVVQHLVLPLR